MAKGNVIRGGRKRIPRLQVRIAAWEKMYKESRSQSMFLLAYRKPGSRKK